MNAFLRYAALALLQGHSIADVGTLATFMKPTHIHIYERWLPMKAIGYILHTIVGINKPSTRAVFRMVVPRATHCRKILSLVDSIFLSVP